jgi:hypothetical protein
MSVSSEDFSVDFSRKAAFCPGESIAFKFFKTTWSTSLKYEDSVLLDWWAANLSLLSYKCEAEIERLLKGKGEYLGYFSRETQHAFAVKVNGLVFLAVQGSSQPEDSILDMKFLKRRHDGIAYHRGFLEACNYLWDDLSSFIQSHNHEVILCGHSLGGAIAQVVASRIGVKKLVTFGSPRAAEAKIKQKITVPYSRYANCCDAVPDLPPFFFGFSHAGNLVSIDANLNLRSQHGTVDKMKAFFSYIFLFRWCRRGQAFSRVFSDHSPINYCTALARNLIENELEK